MVRKIWTTYHIGVGFAGLLAVGALLAGSLWHPRLLSAVTSATPTRSTTIALTRDNQRLVVVNRETNSLSVIQVRTPAGIESNPPVKLAEIAVGNDPRCVALTPDDARAFVTNSGSGTITVIDLVALRPIAEVAAGTEPRGCAMTPNGAFFLAADFSTGKLLVHDGGSGTFLTSFDFGGHPSAIAVTNNGDANDLDETVFVAQFFAEQVPGGPGEGFDTGRRGVVQALSLAQGLTKTTLTPVTDSGFTGDRTNFCPQSTPIALHSNLFCPAAATGQPAGSDAIVKAPQGAFPNQLQSLLIRANFLVVPSIGAAPEPPVKFNVNVQGLIHLVEINSRAELGSLNLNASVKTETQPADPTTSLDKLFVNDIVAIDANPAGTDFLVVSRGGNVVLRPTGGNPPFARYQTGNIPNGVVISSDGTRAYVNNEVGVSVTIIDLANNVVLARDIPSGTPPAPGSFAHAVLVGKLVFFTALGVPDNGVFGTPIRDIVPLPNRGKQSDNGWSSCASCHPDGLTDGVTWIFANGPRQTIPLDGTFDKHNPADQRIMLWSATRGSAGTDFNNNSRAVQGGIGFAGNPPNSNIYNHGIVQGASDALDALTLWIQTVRAVNAPPPSSAAAAAAGATVFSASCASCHGGPKWTKSTILYRDNPAFTKDPAAGGTPIDPGIATPGGGQIASFTLNAQVLTYLDNVGTFNLADPLEMKSDGTNALGGAGFNAPSLLGLHASAPYLHNGKAQTIEDVFPLHTLGGGTIATQLTAQQQADLAVFLRTIDGRTPLFRSAADDFRDAVANP